MRTTKEIQKEIERLEKKLKSEKKLLFTMVEEGVEAGSSVRLIQKTLTKIHNLKWVLNDNKSSDPFYYGFEETEWIGGEKKTKDVFIYHLVNSELHNRHKKNPLDLDLYKGIEYEPWMLLIIQSGFDDWFHVILENGEGGEPHYNYMTSNDIKEEYKIDVL